MIDLETEDRKLEGSTNEEKRIMSEASERVERMRATLAAAEAVADTALKEARHWLGVWEEAVVASGKARAALADLERAAGATPHAATVELEAVHVPSGITMPVAAAHWLDAPL